MPWWVFVFQFEFRVLDLNPYAFFPFVFADVEEFFQQCDPGLCFYLVFSFNSYFSHSLWYNVCMRVF